MEKFQNITLNNKEKSIKIGTNVPADGVNLAFFSNQELSPRNNIVTIDLSETIAENNVFSDSDNESFFALADEFGVLKTLDEKYSFSTDQLTISNLFLNKPFSTEIQDLNNLNPNEFVHYYYISKFFIPSPGNFIFIDLNQYLDQEKLNNLKLKVVDQNGLDYIDANTGRKKYRILLEPFYTSANSNRFEVPHRVIVLLDATEPNNLRLNYDKIQSDENGNLINFEPNYYETINAVPLFNEVPEEAFVIDPNYSNKKQYSVTKINQKYSSIVDNETLAGGYQVISPSKPIDDNRTFEVFNWRMIARTNNSINLSVINEDRSSSILNKTLKVGVLYSSTSNQTNSTIFPYIFYRLENSPFNLSSYNFVNPIKDPEYSSVSQTLNKYEADYWKIDIDTIESLDQFDVLAWSPDKDITTVQASKLNSFLSKNGTLLLDLSYLSISATKLNPQLRISNERISSQYESINSSNVLIDNDKNGGWEISGQIFENQYYGIYGSRYDFNTSSHKNYFYFDQTNDSNSILKLGVTESESETVGVVIPYAQDTDALVSGNVIGVTFRLMSYCNSIYSQASAEQIINSNTGNNSYNLEDGNIFSSIVEGPFKLLYNIVSYAGYSRLYATRETRTNSSLYNFVSNWNSSWVMDGNALLQEEIDKEFTSIAIGSNDVYAKKITQISAIDYYKDQLTNFLQSHHQDVIFGNLNNVEIFIESTNPDVVFSNAESVTSTEANINSSYSLYKITNGNDPIYAYATLSKSSPQLAIPNGIGPYVIREKSSLPLRSFEISSNFNVINSFKSYPFSLRSRFSYLSGTDLPLNFDVNFEPTLKMVFKGTLTETTTTIVNQNPITTLVDVTMPCLNFKSAVDDNILRSTVSNNPANIFLYSGDIDIHKDTRQWKAIYVTKQGQIADGTYPASSVFSFFEFSSLSNFINNLFTSGTKSRTYYINNYEYLVALVGADVTASAQVTVQNKTTTVSSFQHEYIKYIQYTMSALAGISCNVDGIYGTQTTSAVKTFQTNNNQRYLDGTVDSETKSYMAFAWKNLKKTNPTKYSTLRSAAANNSNTASIVKYIDSADAAGTVADINTKVYKKLTFSGFSGPGQGEDILYFKIPDSIERVNKIIIEADASSVWRNWSVGTIGYSSTYNSNIFAYNVLAVNKSAATGTIEISLNGISGSSARHLWIHVIASSLQGFGYAEGFGIKSIKVFGKKYQTFTPDPETETNTTTSDIFALATISPLDNLTGITPSLFKTKSYSTNSFPRESITFDSLIIDCLNDGTIPSQPNLLASGPITINSSQLQDISLTENEDTLFLNDKIKINFSSAPSLIWINNINITSVSSNGTSVTGNPVGITYVNSSDNTSSVITASTSAAFYSDAVVHEVGPFNLSSGYRLRKPNQTNILDSRNSVIANDGVLLLCDNNGDPYGILNNLSISSGLNNLTSVQQQEVNIAYGDFSVYDINGDQPGFIYGFYDKNRLEFIGKTISYIELLARGINNVFIGVCAYDADGNILNQREYIGSSNGNTFIAPRVPLKTIYPLYSVKMKRSSSIRVNQMDQDLTKFDVWNLSVSSGSFWKDFSLDQSRIWGDWKANYLGQTLRAFYSTFDELIDQGSSGFNSTRNVWSQIYGYGHYDVKNENPVLLDDRTIQLRRTPLMNIVYPTDYFGGSAGIVKQQLHIYTRETEESPWVEISHDAIRDINSNTGIIKFRNRLVPSSENLIKVSYVTINKNRMIHQINGNLIPLNPLLSSVNDSNTGISLKYDKPLFIYISPKAIYKDDVIFAPDGTRSSKFVKIEEYKCDSSINFTYDERLFNKNSSKHDPFALPIAIIYVKNNPYNLAPDLYDTRTRGGGVTSDVSTFELIEQIPEVLSNWDVYPPSGMAYARGGYVIIRIPESVKTHFLDEKEIYQIISNNLTAGVAYELQDMNGNTWN